MDAKSMHFDTLVSPAGKAVLLSSFVGEVLGCLTSTEGFSIVLACLFC